MEKDVELAFASITQTLVDQNKVMTSQGIVLAEVAVTTKHLASAVDGNGRPGLLDRMQAMEVNHAQSICQYQRVEDSLNEKIDQSISDRVKVTDAMNKKMDPIIEALPGLKTVARGFWWIAGVLGLAVVGLLWGIFTHTIELMPK